MSSANTTSIDELIENFEFLGDWEQRFTYLIDLGKRLPPMPEEDRNESTRVHGCQATVYMKDHVLPTDPPTLELSACADAHIVNGLIAILMSIYNGRTPDEAIDLDAESIFRRLDLVEHLSPTRRNGLHAMLTRIRALAATHTNGH